MSDLIKNESIWITENLNMKFTNSYIHSYTSLVLCKLEFDRARLSYPLSQGQNPGRPESSPLLTHLCCFLSVTFFFP